MKAVLIRHMSYYPFWDGSFENMSRVLELISEKYDAGVDEMQLAIAISNLLENAIHACENVPEADRFIEVTAKFKQQLLLEISNSCAWKVSLDEDGHPVTSEDGHGIGTRSVLDFVKKTNSEIRYIAEDNVFKVRMIV